METEIKEDEIVLENWRYSVEITCGGDAWRLGGEVWNHPNFPPGHYVYVSTPVSLNIETRVMVTSSGRRYRLGACAGKEEEQLGYILEDIKRKATLII